MRVGILQGYLQIDGENLRTIPACREDRNAFYGGGSPHNMGDWFVTRSIWSELDAEVYYTVHPAAPQKSFDFINSECDVFVLKGGNFLTGNFLSTKIGYEVLSKIKIPMMYIGAGLQAPIGGTVTFTEDEQRCLKYIHDSSESCGVRGETSKEALEKIGITNARVITCPTLFWGCKPELELKKPSMERVGWTMRDVLLSQDRPTQKRQFDLIERLRKNATGNLRQPHDARHDPLGDAP